MEHYEQKEIGTVFQDPLGNKEPHDFSSIKRVAIKQAGKRQEKWLRCYQIDKYLSIWPHVKEVIPLEATAEVAMKNSRSNPAACGVAEEASSPALDL